MSVNKLLAYANMVAAGFLVDSQNYGLATFAFGMAIICQLDHLTEKVEKFYQRFNPKSPSNPDSIL